ncbi:MAG: helix-turn-helix domain-containing protein [Rikenellaceae bacterium]|nr:helix-turn-helix domain-containing protein [Rikenellaceae bacterium]
MNFLSDFVEVQSRIELLLTLFFFIASFYFPFLIYVKKSISEGERRLIKSMAGIFSVIGIILLLRLFMHVLYPEKNFVHGTLLTILSLIIITTPLRKFITSKMDINLSKINFSLIRVTIAALFYCLFLVVYHYTCNLTFVMEKIFVLFFAILFTTETAQIVWKIYGKLKSLSSSDWYIVDILRYGLFLLLSEALLSLSALLFLFMKMDYIYVWSILILLILINGYIIIAPFCLDAPEVMESNENGFSVDKSTETKDKGSRSLNDRLRADDLYERLITYFDQKKPYLRQNLKIKEVALYLYSNKTYLSRIINDKHNLNFNQFVNYYRIEEVKRLFMEDSSLNIQELCTRSGFGSMATFSIAFRYYLGNTPADWCKEQKLLREHE